MKLLITISILLLLLTGCKNDNKNLSNNQSETNSTSNNETSSTNNYITRTATEQKIEKEEEIATYSTPILIKESARQNNVSITCGKLNGRVVTPGETFSFTTTVGKADPNEGYQKADIFDANGKIVKGYGGGNCQISSTLYNAVLMIPTLSIVERHEHSRDVDYVPERKRCSCCIW